MSGVDEFLAGLASDAPPPEVANDTPYPTLAPADAEQILEEEYVVDKNQTVRQAGASLGDTIQVDTLRRLCEASLFSFAKVILKRDYLTTSLHLPVCNWLTDFTAKRRKGLLLPREHAKSSLVSHALPLHILIQPIGSNVYFPGESGAEQRILLACETADLAKKHMGVQRRVLERNELLRALWPERLWTNPRKEAPVWRDDRYTLPRIGDWPDPSVQAIGVDGAITGAHPSVLVKDDLIAIDAANSPVVMQTAIEWHKASRSLVNNPKALEFIIGTRWAVHDLYSDIQENDPTVEWNVRAAVEDGVIIFPPPEGLFTPEKLAELQKDQGSLFLLLYMNASADPSLTDFDLSLLRTYTFSEGAIVIEGDPRDMALAAESDPALRAGMGGQSRDTSTNGKTLASWLAGMGDREKRRLPMYTKVTSS